MASKLETRFFNTFGIPKSRLEFECDVLTCDKELLRGKFACITCLHKSKQQILDYPQITPQRLLELVVLASDSDDLKMFKDVDDLKNTVLNILIDCYNNFLECDYKNLDEWAIEIKDKVLEIFEVEQ